MKNVFRSFGLLFAMAGLFFSAAFLADHKLVQIALFLSAIGVFFGAAILGCEDGIGAALWTLLMAGGTWWAGSKTIETIDFDKPFLLSFYWSTVGYLLLTLLLLLMAVGSFFIVKEGDPKR